MERRTLKLVVQRVNFSSEEGAYIFSGQDEAGERQKVVAFNHAIPRLPRPGDTICVQGSFKNHPRYGMQFHATSGTYPIPKGKLLINYLSNGESFEGIGRHYAQALYDKFKENLIPLLNNAEVQELTKVIPRAGAERLVHSWHEQRVLVDLISYLDDCGFDIRLANKIIRIWGADALNILASNPYAMLAFSSWKLTDAAALSLGFKNTDRKRIVGAVESTLYERLENGHTATSKETLSHLLRKKLHSGLIESAIGIALDEGAICGKKMDGYQPIGAALMEKKIALRIRSMIGLAKRLDERVREERNDKTWIALAIKRVEDKLRFSLNDEQIAAVKMASIQRFCLITGGAGVGKTTVLKAIIDVAKLLGQTIFQMALAGRAAKNMTESSEHYASTIAKFLFQFNSRKLVIPENSFVIIDEASMLDLPLFFRILKCLPEDARILLIGDPAQLPPIGFGLVFSKLAESDLVPKVNLNRVHRQARATGIPQVANAIRIHEVPQLPPYSGENFGVSFIECGNNETTKILEQLNVGAPNAEWQILSAVNDGPAGVHQLNNHFNKKSIGEKLAGFKFSRGEPVMFLRNDYERRLMNGTLGVISDVVNTYPSGLNILFDDEVHFVPSDEVNASIELAYAISVHKAQGSQFNRVAIIVTNSRNLDHALVYTALTRAITQAVFIGDLDALKCAILNPSLASQREVCFQI